MKGAPESPRKTQINNCVLYIASVLFYLLFLGFQQAHVLSFLFPTLIYFYLFVYLCFVTYSFFWFIYLYQIISLNISILLLHHQRPMNCVSHFGVTLFLLLKFFFLNLEFHENYGLCHDLEFNNFSIFSHTHTHCVKQDM